jgi:hypothetical protein
VHTGVGQRRVDLCERRANVERVGGGAREHHQRVAQREEHQTAQQQRKGRGSPPLGAGRWQHRRGHRCGLKRPPRFRPGSLPVPNPLSEPPLRYSYSSAGALHYTGATGAHQTLGTRGRARRRGGGERDLTRYHFSPRSIVIAGDTNTHGAHTRVRSSVGLAMQRGDRWSLQAGEILARHRAAP